MGISTLIGNIASGKKRVQFIQQVTGSVLTLDCSISETHERDSPPTEFEIENGATISDHIILKPIRLDINGMITDTPLSLINALQTTAVSALLPSVAVVGAAAGLALSNVVSQSSSPSLVAFQTLLNMQQAKQPVNVITSLNTYPNMFISKISVPRDANTGRVLMFTVSLVQLLLVSPQNVNIQIFKNPDLSANKTNAGSQGPSIATFFTAGENLATSVANSAERTVGIPTGG